MRKIILSFLILLTVSLHLKAQTVLDYDVLTYNFNGTPVNGIKIKTNMPFTNGTQMPTLIIEGYNYGGTSPIGLLLTYYIYDNVFTSAALSSYGAYTPPVYLANEGGKVVIFINSKDYFLRFSIRAFGQGRSAETVANFEGWTTADEALSGTATAQLLVPYKNQFAGNVYLPGGIWNKDGNVGIGITAPQSGLHVAKVNVLGDGSRVAATLGNAYNDWTTFGAPSGGRIRGSSEGYLAVESNPNGTNKNLYLNLASDGNILMANGGGNVGIGTATPGSNKLAVEGTIGARRVKVTQAAWADFVFQPDYQLPSLQEVEQFVKTNQHLPGVPSEKEIKKEGLDVGEMNKILLQKVEELTLYIIQQQKLIESQEKRLQKLESRPN